MRGRTPTKASVAPPPPPSAEFLRTETCEGASGTTFETVCGSLSRRDEAKGRPTSKSAPRLARARQPAMGIPGLRRFCPGDAYSSRRHTVRWGAPVRARATPPLAGYASAGTPTKGVRRPLGHADKRRQSPFRAL